MSQLPPWHELVCAAVDGELTPHDKKRLKEILRTVPEARKLLREYKSDSKVLASLPIPSVPCDFAAEFKKSRENIPVIASGKDSIFAEGSFDAASVRNRHSNSVLVASLAALAFSALLFAGAGVYWGLVNDAKNQISRNAGSNSPNRLQEPGSITSVPNPQEGSLINRPSVLEELSNTQQANRPGEPAGPTSNRAMESWILQEPKNLEIAKSVSPAKSEGEIASKTLENQGKDENKTSHLLAAPFSNPGSLVEAKIIVPKWVAWEEDNFGNEIKKLISTREKNSAPTYIEIPCNDSILVATHLLEILKSKKLGVAVDRLAQDRLTQKNVRTHIGVCLEIGNPEELGQILHTLHARVHQAGAKSPISPLGKGLAFLPPNAENPGVFNGVQDRISANLLPKTVADLEKATIDSINIRAGKNAAAKKLLLPQPNASGGLDAVFLAQSPYYPEVRSSNTSPEVTAFRHLWKNGSPAPRQTVFIYLRQLLL